MPAKRTTLPVNDVPKYLKILADYRIRVRAIPFGGSPGAVWGLDGELPELAEELLWREPQPTCDEIVEELTRRATEKGVLTLPWILEKSDGLPPSTIPVGATHQQIIAMIAEAGKEQK
jgi:hypothetical protein